MSLATIFKANWLIVCILTIALIVRLWNIHNLTTFSGDQGFDFQVVKEILNGNLTLLGPKIGPYNQVGNLYLGPAYYYLISPFLFLFRLDPIGPAVFTALLSVGATLLIYLIGAKFFSRNVGTISAFFYSINSFIVEQSRATSNPHLIPFFSSLAVFSILASLKKKDNSIAWPIIAGTSIGIIFQLHYLAVSLLVSVTLFFLRNRDFSKFTVLFLGFLIAIFPQIVFEIKHKFFVTNIFLKQILQTESTFNVINIPYQVKDSLDSLNKVLLGNNLLLVFVVSIAVVLMLNQAIKEKKYNKEISLLIVLPVFLNIIFASLYFGNMMPHYFATIYPNIFLILGIIFAHLLKDSKNPILSRSLIILFMLFYTVYNISKLDLNRKEGYTMPKGWNLNGVKKASRLIASDVPSGVAFNIAATIDGDTRAQPYRYLTEVYQKKPLGVENYPEASILYLISRDEQSMIYKYTVWEVESFQPFKIINSWPIQNGINLYKLERK